MAVAQGANHSLGDFLFNIIPTNVVDSFAKGYLLQVLIFSCLFGFGLAALGEKGKVITENLNKVADVLFKIVNIILKLFTVDP